MKKKLPQENKNKNLILVIKDKSIDYRGTLSSTTVFNIDKNFFLNTKSSY